MVTPKNFGSRWLALAAIALVLVACKSSTSSAQSNTPDSHANAGTFKLTSPDFAEGAAIPKKFTCKGADISPALEWSGAPTSAQNYALIVEDPDAPSGTFTHWLVFDIPRNLNGLKQGAGNDQQSGFSQGKNDFGKIGYGGPCPPSGVHHYIFRLFALSQKLVLPSDAAKEQLEKAMKGKILAQSSLTGTFAR
jgi:Raf kinase inhibitor-like YbhB/YbcL family protein